MLATSRTASLSIVSDSRNHRGKPSAVSLRGLTMRKTEIVTWVVYRRMMTKSRKHLESTAICTQIEWDEMELAAPGQNTLVQTGIKHEAVAEKIARGTSGDLVSRDSRNEPRSHIVDSVAVQPDPEETPR